MRNYPVNRWAAARSGAEPQGSHRILHRCVWLGRRGLLAAVLAIILVSCGGGSGTDSAPSTDKDARDLASDFSFTLYQGESKLGAETLNLSDLLGRPVVLNFWAGLCPPCRAEMPDLQDFYEEFSDRVTLIGIDLGQFTGLGTQRDARDLLAELGVTYPAGFTGDSSVVREHQVFSMPSTVFINSNGEVFRKWNGALNRDLLAEVTTDMLNQESGSPP